MGASALTLLTIPMSAACAQDARVTASSQAADSPAVKTADGAAGAGEIIVTAQKRSERLIDVPISIASFGGSQLSQARVTDLRVLQSISPSLIIATSTDRQSTFTFMRGMGTAVQDRGYEQSVAVYVDGVYRGRAGAAMTDLMDIERVEVLRGPQSTLYGRNASVGAINVITRGPSFTPDAAIEATYGNYNAFEMKASIAGPLVEDKIAGRIAVQHIERKGFIHNPRPDQPDADGYSDYSIRGQLLFNLGDTSTFKLIADYTHAADLCCSALLYFVSNAAVGPTGNYRGITPPTAGVPGVLYNNQTSGTFYDPFQRVTYANGGQRDTINDGGLSGELNSELGFAKLTAIGSYRIWNFTQNIDIDWSDSPIVQYINIIPRQRFKEGSGEVRLANLNPSPLEWMLGGYYFRQDMYEHAIIPGLSRNYAVNQTVRSLAAFGQLTYHLTDKLSATGGLRYLHERKHEVVDALIPGELSTPPGGLNNNDNALMGGATINYKASSDANFYAKYSKGYKSGGIVFQLSAAALLSPTTKPEHVDAYEIGGKFRAFDNRLSVNTALYYQIIDGLHAQTRLPGQLTYITLNAARIKSHGFEVDVTYRPTSDFTLSNSVAYTHARYGAFPVAPVPIGSLTGSQDLSGRVPLRAPTWSITGSATYDVHLSDTYVLEPNIGYRWSTKYFTDLVESPFFVQKAALFLDASITLKSSDRWSLQGWVKNATNKNLIRTGTSLIGGANSALIYPGDPRTFGLTGRVTFR
jgi:iron complex outermembrane receptor protein